MSNVNAAVVISGGSIGHRILQYAYPRHFTPTALEEYVSTTFGARPEALDAYREDVGPVESITVHDNTLGYTYTFIKV